MHSNLTFFCDNSYSGGRDFVGLREDAANMLGQLMNVDLSHVPMELGE